MQQKVAITSLAEQAIVEEHDDIHQAATYDRGVSGKCVARSSLSHENYKVTELARVRVVVVPSDARTLASSATKMHFAILLVIIDRSLTQGRSQSILAFPRRSCLRPSHDLSP